VNFERGLFMGWSSYRMEIGSFPGINKEGNGYRKIGFNVVRGTSEKVK